MAVHASSYTSGTTAYAPSGTINSTTVTTTKSE